jgi:ABC-2 type transport system permease protein
MDRAAEFGLHFVRAEAEAAELRAGVQDVTYACSLVVTDTGITMYENDRFSFNAHIARSALQGYLREFNTFAAIAATDPGAAARAFAAAAPSFAEAAAIEGARQARAIDYYAVTMLTFIVMMASVLGVGAMKREMKLHTARRILCSPVRRGEFLVGKLAGGILVTAVEIVAVILFSRYVIGAWWGTDVPTVVAIVLSQAVMAVALGAAVAFVIPHEGAAIGILNSIFPVLVLFAGGYGEISNAGPVFQAVASADPIAWVNRAVFGVIYSGDYSAVPTAVLVCLGAAVVFLALAALIARREDF